MTSPAELIQNSSLVWLMATGLALGALHALEPGHSKTMMAAFVVAIRGTVPQAILLGLSAALSHSLLIWALAAAAIYTGNEFIGADVEPWLQLGSGVVIVAIGASMAWRQMRLMAARRTRPTVGPQGGRLVDTGHGFVEVTIFEQDVPPQFQLYFYDARMRPIPAPAGETATIRTVRADGTTQDFRFEDAGLCLAGHAPIPEPHEFDLVLSLAHGDHAHDFRLRFVEDAHHHHDHDHAHGHDHHHGAAGEDAHARAHARQIERHIAGKPVSNRQIALFGLSGGLMPCPAALTMLLVCLRLKKVALGVGVVASFSLGLAATMVAVGVIAAIGVHRAERHLPRFAAYADALPYVSSALVVAVGVFMAVSGYSATA